MSKIKEEGTNNRQIFGYIPSVNDLAEETVMAADVNKMNNSTLNQHMVYESNRRITMSVQEVKWWYRYIP